MHSRLTISGTARIAALALLLLSLCAPATVFAAPPDNDDFNSATVITSLPYNVTETTSEATTAADDPWCNPPNSSVWFAFTPSTKMALTLNTWGSSYGAQWTMFTGARGALNPVAGSAPCFPGLPPTIMADAGTTYYIMVTDPGGMPGMWSGGYLTFSLNGTVAPANDDFDHATAITSLPFSTTQNVAAATVASDDPACNWEPNPISVWFSYTPTQDLALRPTFSGTSFQGYMCVYTGTRGALTKVLGPNILSGSFTFDVQAGTTYYFMVVSYYGWGGDLVFALNGYPHLKATMEVTGGTVDSKSGIATLKGTLNCSRPAAGTLVVYKFEQPVGRVNIIKSDISYMSINNCNSVTPWQVTLVPTNGKYAGGKVNANIGLYLYDSESGESVFLPATDYVLQLTGANTK